MSQMMTSLLARDPERGSRSTERRRLAVVSPQDTSGSVRFPVLCLSLLLAGLGAVLGLNTAMAQDSFEVQRLEGRSAALSDTQESLTHDIDERSAPQALADRADELGMVPADSAAFVDLEKGAVLGVAEPATRPEGLTVDAATDATASEGTSSEKESGSGSSSASSEKGEESEKESASASSTQEESSSSAQESADESSD